MSELTELIPGLPEDISLECLIRLPYMTHRFATRVSRRWQDLIQSKDFYYHRKQTGRTHKAACLVQAIPVQSGSDASKSIGSVAYGISVFDSVSESWERVEPVPKYPNGLPLFCRVVSSEGKLVVMGGWDPSSYDPVKDVFVYEFTNRRWRQGKDMPEKRSFFAAGELNGKVIVAGGHDENKNALSTAWAYDVRNDDWTELARMSQERDECEGVVIGSEFWVVSGYGTERQGSFERSAEALDVGTGEWRRVEDTWTTGQTPRSCVGVEERGGKLFCWGESEAAGIRVGACAVGLGSRSFVTGSDYQGGPHGFYVTEKREGKNDRLKKLDVPDEFNGFVQSGCCVDV